MSEQSQNKTPKLTWLLIISNLFCLYLALSYWHESKKAQTETNQAYNEKGVELLTKGKYKGALDQFRLALQINPNSLDTYINLANGYKFSEKYKEALEIYQMIMFSFGNTYHNVAEIHRQLGDDDNAIKFLKLAIDMNPNTTDSRINLGNLLRKQNKEEEALEQYQKVLAINPNESLAYYSIANSLYHQGKFEESLENFEKVMTLNPDQSIALVSEVKIEEIKEKLKK